MIFNHVNRTGRLPDLREKETTMKRLTVVILAATFALAIPLAASAMKHMDHSEHGKAMAEEKMQHGDMEHADQGKHMGHEKKMEHAKEKSHDMHKGHDMGDDDFAELGKDVQKGVVATVKVKTYDDETKAKMAKMGMAATHHVMVFFTEESSGKALGGKAALKVKDQEGKPTMLMQMGDGFGADVNLGAGMHTLEIGTKLQDGEKRQFEVGFHNM